MLPAFDPWDPEPSRRTGRHKLTSVEVTVTNRCNMRCRHCAVGEVLAADDPERLPLDLLLARLDEVESLRTLSITGGEPSENLRTLTEYVLPLLQYAKGRGLYTQVNTNLTMDLKRYVLIAPYTDVIHITWNYRDLSDFHRIVWGHGRVHVSLAASEKLFMRIVDNARALSQAGWFLSAESMVNRETAPHLGSMNRIIASLGCRRHEVHPMYPVDWAADLTVLTKEEYRVAVDRFLSERDPELWVLFGTFPFLACSPVAADQALLQKVHAARNVSVRNCPDGRSRVNVNAFTGDVYVTDFADLPPLGRITAEPITAAFDRWQRHPVFAPYDCYCHEVGCTGPNLVVANTYLAGVDFRTRRAVTERLNESG